MRFLRAGRSAVLVEVADLDSVVKLHAALRARPPAGVVDMVPAARTVLLVHDGSTMYARIAEQVRALPVAAAPSPDRETVDIPVRYDGADLAEVVAQTGLTKSDVIRRHQAGEYVVAFIGFAPGFGYLIGGDPKLRVRRRDTPRTRVPAGSVALAGEFTGVYPREGPGGWQLIGHTGVPLWDLSDDPPALLVPGVRVRFVERDS